VKTQKRLASQKHQPKQLTLFQPRRTDSGGSLRNKRAGRGERSLTHKHSIHLVLRTSKAKGKMSFTYGNHRQRIAQIVYKHANNNAVQIISFANVGNHLHLHIRLAKKHLVKIARRARYGDNVMNQHRETKTNIIHAAIAIDSHTFDNENAQHEHEVLNHRELYNRFIRAVTGAIALTLLAASPGHAKVKSHKDRFWDQRPFTRHITDHKHFLNMKDYLAVNRLEGHGFNRINARLELAFRYDQKHPPDFDDS